MYSYRVACLSPVVLALRNMRTFALLSLLTLSWGKTLAQRLPQPVAIIELPTELREISGLTAMDSNTVACLQDEAATIYLVALREGRILEHHPFGPPSDLEGITRVGDELFALRSDGLIYRIDTRNSRYTATDSFRMDLPFRNFEGLGHDLHTGLVLVAPKDVPKGSTDMRDQRKVYAFNPKTLAFLPEPVLRFSVKDMLRQALKAGVQVPMRNTAHGGMEPIIKFRMSSITVQPATGRYFILSAVDQSLLVLNRDSSFNAFYVLDKMLLPKPEGITFMPDGDMLIATEGKHGAPRIVRYQMD